METNAEGLFPYGIYQEKSDIRAHVCVDAKCVCVFQTKNGIAAIEKFNPPVKPATQPGASGATATGWLVKPEQISGLRKIERPGWPCWGRFKKEMSTSEKGKLAVEIVIHLLKCGHFPLWVDNACDDKREEVQIKGTDIVVFCRQRIQVKCDWKGAMPNLYIQQKESNPFKRT